MTYQVLLVAHFAYLLPESCHGRRGILHAGEDIGEETVQKRDVVCHQLRHHCFHDRLDEYLLFGQSHGYNQSNHTLQTGQPIKSHKANITANQIKRNTNRSNQNK